MSDFDCVYCVLFSVLVNAGSKANLSGASIEGIVVGGR